MKCLQCDNSNDPAPFCLIVSKAVGQWKSAVSIKWMFHFVLQHFFEIYFVTINTVIYSWAAWRTSYVVMSCVQRLSLSSIKTWTHREIQWTSQIPNFVTIHLVLFEVLQTDIAKLPGIWHSEDRASWYILIIKPTRSTNFSHLFL